MKTEDVIALILAFGVMVACVVIFREHLVPLLDLLSSLP